MKKPANKPQTIPVVVLTLEERQAQARTLFGTYLANELKYGLATVEAFKAQLDKDPFHALEWGQSIVESIALFTVVKEVEKLYAVDAITLSEIVAHCTREGISGARRPEQSSSTLSNYAKQCRTVAYLKFAESVGQFTVPS